MSRVPIWMDREYIETILREKHRNQRIQVLEIEVLPATEKDQNFASVIFRLKVKYTRDGIETPLNTSLIAKTSLENGDNESLHNALEKFDVYEHEAFIYEEVLPKSANLLRKVGMEVQLAPEIIQFDRKRKCMLFEDLCLRRYIMCDKRKGFDLRHTKMILEKVAKFHAAAARQNELSRGSLQKFNRSIFSSNDFEPFFAGQLRVCGLAMLKWRGYENYGHKILNLVPKIMELGRDVFEAKPEHFNTIIHGDLWVNNTMFKYDDYRPIDVILLDFQFSCWTSPAVDLHYLLSTSISFNIRANCEVELVKHYYQHLIECLQKLEYKGKVPSYQSFWEQYIDKSFYALTSACITLALVLNEEEIDNSSLMKDEESLIREKLKIYKQHKIQTILQRLLPIFDIRGYFDK